MAERVRTPLVLGEGLDRASGVMAADPRALREARNVYLLGGKVQARRGMAARETYLDDTSTPVSHVLAVTPLRQHGEMLVVGYQQATGKVWLYRCKESGTAVARFDQPWFALQGDSPPPVVVSAVMDDRVFLAHDEPLLSRRAPTVYYTPTQLPSVTLPALLYPGSAEPLRFRGVAVHLNYLVGWGFGTPTEERSEIVRVSKPASPLEFDADDYWIVGQIGDPVTALASVDNTLVAFKLGQTYQLVGDNARNFGSKPFPTDASYGCVGSRMAVVHNGRCYYWSLSGPRVTLGTGPSEDLAVPLDLLAPAPEGLVAEGEARLAFALHHADERALLFVFGRRVYCLSLIEGQGLRWSYLELGQEVFSGAQAYTTVDYGSDASARVVRLDPTLRYGSFGLVLENRFTKPTDVVNVWVRKTGGAWEERGSFASTAAAQQTVLVDGLDPDATYTLAVRVRRGQGYAPTHAGAPDTWPEWARATGKVCGTPRVTGSSWSYTEPFLFESGQHVLTAHLEASVAGVVIEVERAQGYAEMELVGTVSNAALGAPFPAEYGAYYAIRARHRFRDPQGVLTYSPYHPFAAQPTHYCGPREMPQIAAATSPSAGALRAELAAPIARDTVLFYSGPHPSTKEQGWWPLGTESAFSEHGITPLPIEAGGLAVVYGVPHLKGLTVQVKARSAVILPIGLGQTQWFYGPDPAGSTSVLVLADGAPATPKLTASGTPRDTGSCVVEEELAWSTTNFDTAKHRLEYRVGSGGFTTLSTLKSGKVVVDSHTGRIAPEGAGGTRVAYTVDVRIVDKTSGAVLASAERVYFDFRTEPCSQPLVLIPAATPREPSGVCTVEDVLSWTVLGFDSSKHRLEYQRTTLAGTATSGWSASGIVQSSSGARVLETHEGRIDPIDNGGSGGSHYGVLMRVVEKTSGAVLTVGDLVRFDYFTRPCPPPPPPPDDVKVVVSVTAEQTAPCAVENTLHWSIQNYSVQKHLIEYQRSGGAWERAEDGLFTGEVFLSTRTGVKDEPGTSVNVMGAVRILDRTTLQVLAEHSHAITYTVAPCPPPLTLTASLSPRTTGSCGIEDVLTWSTSGFDAAKHRLEYRVNAGGWIPAGVSGSEVLFTRDGRIHFVDEGPAGWSRVHYSAAVRVMSIATSAELQRRDLAADYWTEPCDSGPPGGGGGVDDPPTDEPPPEGGGGDGKEGQV